MQTCSGWCRCKHSRICPPALRACHSALRALSFASTATSATLLCKHSHICHSALQAQPRLPLSFARVLGMHQQQAQTGAWTHACLVLSRLCATKCLGLSRLCATSVLACHACVQQVSWLVTPVCNKCLVLSHLCAISVLACHACVQQVYCG